MSDSQSEPTNQEQEFSALKRFVGTIIDRDDGAPYDWDGGEIQALAQCCGLYIAVDVVESCGDGCNCYDFPTVCFRASPLATECLRAITQYAD